jgi:hypothetical protein
MHTRAWAEILQTSFQHLKERTSKRKHFSVKCLYEAETSRLLTKLRDQNKKQCLCGTEGCYPDVASAAVKKDKVSFVINSYRFIKMGKEMYS